MKRWVAALLAGLVLACAGPTSETIQRKTPSEALGDPLDAAIPELESAVSRNPGSTEARDELGRMYYMRARRALEEERYDAYEADLGRALDQWIESVRLNPGSATPHTWMGIVAVYQGDLNRALTSFQNARRLNPRSPIVYTNLAETYIYMDKVATARRYLEGGRRRGAPPVVLELNEALAAWRSGDLIEAEDVFASAYALDPEQVNNINEAPVGEPIETFEEYMAYCCEKNPACGPFLEQECGEMQLAVKRREVADETLLLELRLEMDRRRRLQEIYRNRKDLQVEIEQPEETP